MIYERHESNGFLAWHDTDLFDIIAGDIGFDR